MTPTIGLAMIVRDEAAVIERCLQSVLPLIDAWTIVDTGSTDGTAELIASTLADVPGHLHRRRWQDFGANRTELMQLAAGSADYLLLLDADMTVVVTNPVGELDADEYLVRHLGDLEYRVGRLVRGDRPWCFVGSTHEHRRSKVGSRSSRCAKTPI
jgi:glycosyltransferase involved in cell wall biosynthesis